MPQNEAKGLRGSHSQSLWIELSVGSLLLLILMRAPHDSHPARDVLAMQHRRMLELFERLAAVEAGGRSNQSWSFAAVHMRAQQLGSIWRISIRGRSTHG